MKKASKLLSALLVVSQLFGYTPTAFAKEEAASPTPSSESATIQEETNGEQTEGTVDSTPETTPEVPTTDSSTEEQPTTPKPEQPVEPETPTVSDSSEPETTPVAPEQKPEENQPGEESKPTDSPTIQTPQKPETSMNQQPTETENSSSLVNQTATIAPVIDKVKNYHQAPTVPIQELVPESTLSSDGTIHFEKNESVEQFIQKIGEAARKVGQENDLYASVMIAQAILESASGQSLLSKAPNYNLFGIKGTHNGKGLSFATQEDLGAIAILNPSDV